jgi:DNA-binding CsgD family transcriptional regulator
MPHRKTVHDHWRPPLFCPEEWCEIVTLADLSPRQAQVVGLVMQSQQDKEIIAALNISQSTLRAHIKEAKVRLEAKDRVGLAYRMFWKFREVVEPKAYPWAFRILDNASVLPIIRNH